MTIKIPRNQLRCGLKTKSMFWSGHHKALISILWKICGAKKASVSKVAYKPDCASSVLSGGTDQNYGWFYYYKTNYCENLLEGNQKHLTQIKQFKGNDTKHRGNVLTFQIFKKVIKKKNSRKKILSPIIRAFSIKKSFQ